MAEAADPILGPPSPDERWPKPRWPRRGLRPVLAGLFAVALNAAAVFGTAWYEHHRVPPATAEQETPVEVVSEIPQPKADPQPKPDPTPEPEPAAQPAPPAQPSPPPPPAPPPAAPPAPASASQPVEVEVSHGSATGAPTADPSEAPPDQPASEAAASAATTEAKAQAYPSQAEAATATFRLVPPTFRGAALPGAPMQTREDYKNLVFGMLERAKRLPPRGPGRTGARAAYVRFMLDRAGNLVSVSLIGSSGDAALDAEAVALVRRAAPFPKPPPEGTLLVFTPVIYFVYDD